MVDIRIIKGAFAQQPAPAALLPPFIAVYALMGIWGLGMGMMAYWGPLVLELMPFTRKRGLSVVQCLPVERSRLANSMWVMQVFGLPALVSGIALLFTAVLLIGFHDSPGRVLGRWLVFTGLNVVMSGTGSAYLALFTRAKVMRQSGGYGSYVLNLCGAFSALFILFVLFMRPVFSFDEVGEGRVLACVGACAFAVVSFVLREYLIVDARTLSAVRKPRADERGLSMRNLGGKVGFLANLMRITLVTYLGLIALMLAAPRAVLLLSGVPYPADGANSLMGFYIGVACVGIAWILILRARMMARTLRMLPLTSTGIVALMTGRYGAMVLGVMAALVTLQGAFAFQLGYLAYVAVLGLLGVILVVAALSLFTLEPQYLVFPVVMILNFFVIMRPLWPESGIHIGLLSVASAILVFAGLGLHYYAVTHLQVMYRVPNIRGEGRFQ